MADRRPSRRWPLLMWRVSVAAHNVAGRWEIPTLKVEIPAANATHACEIVLRRLHSDAGVPSWKPCLRESLEHATATARPSVGHQRHAA